MFSYQILTVFFMGSSSNVYLIMELCSPLGFCYLLLRLEIILLLMWHVFWICAYYISMTKIVWALAPFSGFVSISGACIICVLWAFQ